MLPALYERIAANKERILSLWQAAALPQGAGLPLTGLAKTRFAAPAEYLVKEEVEALFDWLQSDVDPVEARPSLQEICRLKAIQAINPSEALGFIPDLKGIIRLVLDEDKLSAPELDGLKELDRRIDQLMLLAFDEYSHCREQIMEIKVDEVRRLAGRSA